MPKIVDAIPIGPVEAEVRDAIARAAVEARTGGGWVIVTLQDGSIKSLESNDLCCAVKFHDRYCTGIDERGKIVSFSYAEVRHVAIANAPSRIVDVPYKSFPERDDGRPSEDDLAKQHFGQRGEKQENLRDAPPEANTRRDLWKSG
jgi:hypothetical protein